MKTTAKRRPVQNRHEFVLFFDVTNGNPNGDPDTGNFPRVDPETNRGLVSDVALKRKVRNYVALVHPETAGHEIYMSEGVALNAKHRKAWTSVMPRVTDDKDRKKMPKDEADARKLTRWMCDNFWDVRAFGAVMGTSINVGHVRGPVQFAFARSVEPVVPLEISITRLAATTEADAENKHGRTMGRKHIVPYGLYRVHGYVSAPLASHPVKGTGFSEDDLELFWQALVDMFEHDRSSARGEMATRRLIVFRHDSALGNAQAQSLFDRVETQRVYQDEERPIGDALPSDWPAARHWNDYKVTIKRDRLPKGIEIIERC